MEQADPYPADSLGLFDMTDRDYAGLVLSDLDYDAQLAAIRGLLRNNRKADEELQQEIKEIEAFAERTSGLRNEHAVADLIERYHASIYQDAAHSMAAVGVLAPLFEAIFTEGLRNIGTEYGPKIGPASHERFAQANDDPWDCHSVWSKGRRSTNIVQGIMQLSDAVGLKQDLPCDLKATLEALFAYRNKMFHHGFEWPPAARDQFDASRKQWPDAWFQCATSDNKPWVYYMSPDFIEHCLQRVDDVIAAFGVHCKRRRPKS